MSEQDGLLLTPEEKKGATDNYEYRHLSSLDAQLTAQLAKDDDSWLAFLGQFLQFTPTPSLEAIIDLIKSTKSLQGKPFIGQELLAKAKPRQEEMSGIQVACLVLNIMFYKVPSVAGDESGEWWEAELRDKNIPIRWDRVKGEFVPNEQLLSQEGVKASIDSIIKREREEGKH